MLLTFGLLSPDKGIEHVIDALPAILARYPDTVYIVLGATHPHVKERHGETYRLMLEHRAQRLGVDSSIIFHDRFVSQDELTEFLAAADIYVTPYLKPEQITSGTLAYAVGAGQGGDLDARICTRASSSPTGAASSCRGGTRRRSRARSSTCSATTRSGSPCCERAAAHGRRHAVAGGGASLRARASSGRAPSTRTGCARVFQAKTLAERPAELPEINLEHLRLMTDETGILQHAAFSVPRYDDGYCLDDNARALLLMALVEDAGTEDAQDVRALASRYLAFVSHAFNQARGRFRNFMSYSRQWLEECGSEDSHGRALWALGTVVGRSGDPGRQSLGGQLFHAALPAVADFTSPRAWAFALLGIDEYLRAFQGDSNVQCGAHRRSRSGSSTSSGGRAGATGRGSRTASPTATRACRRRSSCPGAWMEHEEMTAAGMRSLEWLASIQCSDGRLLRARSAPTASTSEADQQASFDQQPVEACAMVSACLEAQRVTGDAALGRARAPRLQLVPRAEPAAAVALRRDDRRLPRRAARRSREREPGRGSRRSPSCSPCWRCARPIGADIDTTRGRGRSAL